MIKRFTAICIIFSTVIISISVKASTDYLGLEINPDTSNWFTWELPDDSVALGSAIDASFMLDAPAGKYGFARANGEYIEFFNGKTATPARFWGTNIGGSAVFDSYEELDKLAERTARSGYNLLRLHAIDAFFTENNIFGVTNGAVTTRELDPSQLDKMFYLISKLKQKGIYIYLDLMSYRPILAGDNITDMSGFSHLGTIACFDPYVIQLQKEYANQLLTTENPYTGSALKDESALVFLAIHNEMSLAELIDGFYKSREFYSIPYYSNQLKSLFNAWLKNKYNTNTNLKNAWAPSFIESLQGIKGLQSNEDLDANSVEFSYNYYETASSFTSSRISDTNRFVYQVVGNMYEDMISYLKNDIGVKCLITGSTLGNGAMNSPSMSAINEFTDFVDSHQYNAHPTNWFSAGSIFQGMGSSLSATGWNLFWRLNYFRTEKPYVIGEYNSCIPNPYGAETEVVMAALASFHNWYPIHYALKTEQLQNTSKLYDAFMTYTSPVRASLQPSSAILYHRHDVKESDTVLEIPNTKDNIINNKWPSGKISHNKYSDYGKVRYKIYSDSDGYNSHDMVSFNNLKSQIENKLSSGETQISDEIIWDRQNTLFKVTTPFANVVSGYTENKLNETDDSIIDIKNKVATVTLVSLTDNTLHNTERMLLTTAAREQNTGMVMSGETIGLMLDTGTSPILVEPVCADITIKTTDCIAVYALSSSGVRKKLLPVVKTQEGYSKFTVNGNYKTLHYEIVRGTDNLILDTSFYPAEQTVKISGVDGRGLSGKGVTMFVIKPHRTLDSLSELNILNAADIIYYARQGETCENGYFEFVINMASFSEIGEYKVVLAFEDLNVPEASRTTTFYYEPATLERITVSAEYDESTNKVTVSGTDLRRQGGKNITMLVLKPSDRITAANEITLSDIYNSIYIIRQTTTDELGNYSFEYPFPRESPWGNYKVLVSAEGLNVEEQFRTDNFFYCNVNSLELYKDGKWLNNTYAYQSNGDDILYINDSFRANMTIASGFNVFSENIRLLFNVENYTNGFLSFDLKLDNPLNNNIIAGIKSHNNEINADVSNFIKASVDWQTVNIPLSYIIGNSGMFNWDEAIELNFRLGSASAGKALVDINNLKFGINNNYSFSNYYFSFLTDEQNNIHANYLIPNSNIFATVDVSDLHKNTSFVLAVYKNNVLIDVFFRNVTENRISIPYSLPNDVNGFKLKALLVESAESLKPIGNFKELKN